MDNNDSLCFEAKVWKPTPKTTSLIVTLPAWFVKVNKVKQNTSINLKLIKKQRGVEKKPEEKVEEEIKKEEEKENGFRLFSFS